MAPTPDRQLYARAAPRLQAWLRDFLVQMAIVATCITMAVVLGNAVETRLIVITCGLILLLYEPLCLTLAGGTIGQISMNLRVVRAHDFGRVSFGRAVARTLVKNVIGLWVFMAIYFTRRSQALHDLTAGTVVVPRERTATPLLSGFAAERARG